MLSTNDKKAELKASRLQVVEVSLRAVAAVSAATCLVWVLGSINIGSDGSVPGAFAEYSLDWVVSAYEPTVAQRIIYVDLQCLLSLGIAWPWWSLARLVASSRRDDPVTADNANRLRLLGVLLAIGGPAYAIGMWLVHRWLLATSELADEASVAPLLWRDVPWWSVAAGLSLLVLAGVWRRGVAMRHDLAGLV